MEKKLQDRAWRSLPKEFREEVKEIYSSIQYMMDMREPQIYANKSTLLEALFGEHNLISEEKPEDIRSSKQTGSEPLNN